MAARANEIGLRVAETVAFAFRRRYLLPPTDPRFLDATYEQMLIDHWAWAHVEDPKLRHEVFIAEGFEEDLAEMEAESLAKEAELAAKIAATPEDDWEEVS